nr:secreted RxLR effector protein 161-like [Nicotiana tomentosiformis]
MDGAHPLSTLMVVRSLNVNKDLLRPQEKNEEVLGPEIPYLNAVGVLMYLANTTRPDITFSINVLARYCSAPTRRHWNEIKYILRPELVGYADTGYLSDPHKARSQTGYVFTCGGTIISWQSTKQSIVAISSNHAEIIAIHEARRECIVNGWLVGASSGDIEVIAHCLFTYADHVSLLPYYYG